MFEWKVEEMKFMNMGKYDKEYYVIEYDFSTEEKREILSKYSNGNTEYFIKLNNMYMDDIENKVIKCDVYGYPKENSKKSWIRKHDTKNVFWNGINKDNLFTKDYFREPFFGYYNDWYFGYVVNDAMIDKTFHKLLKYFEEEEKKYFCKHDEYEVLKTKFRNYGCPCFGVYVASSSNGCIYILDTNDDRKKREITIDELKLLLSKYEELKTYEEKLCKEINIEF